MEVAGRAFVSNLEAMERAGFDTARLLNGLGLDLREARHPGYRGTWEGYLSLIERFHAWHGDEGFSRCARIQTTVVPETHAIAGLLVTPRNLLRFLMRRVETTFLTVEVALALEEEPHTQVWWVRIRPEHRASMAFMVGIRAALEVFPRFLDLPNASVEAELDPRASMFRVRLPLSGRRATSLASLPDSATGAMLVAALEAGERSVRDLYDRLRADAQQVERGKPAPLWGLTGRQFEVATWLVQGRSNKQIAESLGCGVRTVEAHVAAVLRKAGVSSRAELVAKWFEASRVSLRR